MTCRFTGLMIVAVAMALLPATAWAQNVPGTITATGTERVRVQPKAIRFVHEIQVSGKTAEQAVQRLQAQRETAMAKLKELGAEEDSIHGTPASVARNSSVQPGYYSPYSPSGCPCPPSGYSPPSTSTMTPFGPASAPIPPTYVPVGTHPPPAPTISSPPASVSAPVSSTYAPPGLTPASPGTVDSSVLASPLPNDPIGTRPQLPPAVYPNPSPQFRPGGDASSGSGVNPLNSQPTQPAPGYFRDSIPLLYVARTTLTAKWPINANKPDDIALVMERLREKLVSAKLDGNDVGQPPVASSTSTPPSLYPNAAMPQMASPSGYCVPGGFGRSDDLQLMCIGELSKSERKNAWAAAMTKAKEQAAELAEAAGCHLGPMASVSGNLGVGSCGCPVAPMVTYRSGFAPHEDEVVLFSPDLPEMAASITVQYQIAP